MAGEPTTLSDGATVAVVGAAGYAGSLTARLIQRHPWFQLQHVTARSDVGRRLDEVYPQYRVPLELEEFDLERHGDVDAAVVAYPHGASAPVVAQLRERGVKVVDLSADFRLRDLATYEEWYKPHPEPQLIDDAVYGLPSSTGSGSMGRRWSQTQAVIRPRRSWRWPRWPAHN